MTSPNAEERSDREFDRKAFGELIRSARLARKMSQAALARAVAISPVFVSQIETGQRIPSDRIAKNIATTLGLPWQEVLRTVYRLRSREAGELFAASEDDADRPWRAISEIPAFRFLLLQIAGLNLSKGDIETLVRNWTNDLALITHLAKVQEQ